MLKYFFCDTSGEPFGGAPDENLGNFCAVAHDCPHCGQLASRGRTLAWLALECHTKGKAVFPCMSCGGEIEFPARLFVPECLTNVAAHFQPNALLRALTPDEVLANDWGEQLFAANADRGVSGPIEKQESALELGEPGDSLGDELRSKTGATKPVLDALDAFDDVLGGIEESPSLEGGAQAKSAVDFGPVEEMGGLEEIFEEPDRSESILVDTAEPSQDVLELSAESEPEIEFLEIGGDREAAEAAYAPVAEATREFAGRGAEKPAAPALPEAPPQRAWDGRGSCPACGATGPMRQSQALDCAACGVHFWTRQENLDRSSDSRVTCPRCKCVMVIPASVWCAVCGQCVLLREAVRAAIRLESAGADMTTGADAMARRKRGGAKAKRSWWR